MAEFNIHPAQVLAGVIPEVDNIDKIVVIASLKKPDEAGGNYYLAASCSGREADALIDKWDSAMAELEEDDG